MKTEERSKRITSAPVYLRNTYEGLVFRSTTEGRFFARWPGESEYEIKRPSNILTDTLLEWNEITEEEYERF